MRLSKEALKELKEIYHKECGERISDEEAREMGENLLSVFEVVYCFIPKDDKQRP